MTNHFGAQMMKEIMHLKHKAKQRSCDTRATSAGSPQLQRTRAGGWTRETLHNICNKFKKGTEEATRSHTNYTMSRRATATSPAPRGVSSTAALVLERQDEQEENSEMLSSSSTSGFQHSSSEGSRTLTRSMGFTYLL